MPLTFYNTATRCKEEFVPLTPGQVKLYTCGPTVYDYFHVGNARAFVVFDTLRRVLERRGLTVTFVQNITDVDDKIINRANREGRNAREVADQFAAAFQADLSALGCRPADVSPKATEHIQDIIELIVRLVKSGHAYELSGDVYFSVRSFPSYGKISGKNIDELEQGARIEVDARKRDPLDFALWKTAKPGEPSWASPWGQGRPGWHIECSAMSMKYLGDSFDIHGGGEDLVFPHHENENAQSESVTGKPLARYWLHNGYLKIDGEKMSKSLGNFRITRDVLAAIAPRNNYQVLRFFMLSAHYRSPLDFNPDNIQAAKNGFEEFGHALEKLASVLEDGPVPVDLPDMEAELLEQTHAQAVKEFDQALDDDLNTAGALGHLLQLANGVRQLLAGRKWTLTKIRKAVFEHIQQDLLAMAEVLGIRPDLEPTSAEVKKLIQQRDQARANRNWAEADKLRESITVLGRMLDDVSSGWSLASTTHEKFYGETNQV